MRLQPGQPGAALRDEFELGGIYAQLHQVDGREPDEAAGKRIVQQGNQPGVGTVSRETARAAGQAFVVRQLHAQIEGVLARLPEHLSGRHLDNPRQAANLRVHGRLPEIGTGVQRQHGGNDANHEKYCGGNGSYRYVVDTHGSDRRSLP
jgi:hypothetical protein